MSLSSTSTIKAQLEAGLGPKSAVYFETLGQFISGQVSRSEFDDSVRQTLDTPHLVQLHNVLIISLFDASAHQRGPLTPPPDAPRAPPRKRRRLLPYQGPDFPDDGLRSSRLKRWTVSMGKRERERLRGLQNTVPVAVDVMKLKSERDEIAKERGVVLLPERGEPPGSRLPLHLASVSRGWTLQHISDRINLISAQHNLIAPSKIVSSLLMLAFEAKLKQIITHALTLTSSSHAISSIHPSAPHTNPAILSPSSFETLFTLCPAVLPNGSSAAMQLLSGEGASEDDEDGDVAVLKDREVRDYRWQMLALLGERSTVKEALRTLR